jgi:FkbH-like protein
LFEVASITKEDLQRSSQYKAETERRNSMAFVADMGAYLESLGMEASIRPFSLDDVPRLAQLINKSNQFNLTTRRRTESEVIEAMGDSGSACLSMRLSDKFGDNGLISIVIAVVNGRVLEIDTWLMSCRVLKRQVEETMLNEIVRIAKARHCTSILGTYAPTKKNEMVKDFYPRMGFVKIARTHEKDEFTLDVASYVESYTKIKITAHPYESN